MENSFQIGESFFKLNKIDAFKQFHIVRRLGPVLADLIPALTEIAKMKKTDDLSEEEKLQQLAKFATPIMNGLSKLSDQDAELVLHGLLNSVEYKQSTGNFARVSNGTMIMIQTFELPQLLQIASKAFAFNLSSFFSALPQK